MAETAMVITMIVRRKRLFANDENNNKLNESAACSRVGKKGLDSCECEERLCSISIFHILRDWIFSYGKRGNAQPDIPCGRICGLEHPFCTHSIRIASYLLFVCPCHGLRCWPWTGQRVDCNGSEALAHKHSSLARSNPIKMPNNKCLNGAAFLAKYEKHTANNCEICN